MSSPTQQFENLQTLDDVRDFVRAGYSAAMPGAGGAAHPRIAEFGFKLGKLPLAVAESGPLIEHAVALAGPNGLTLQEIRAVFGMLSEERIARGLEFARTSGELVEAEERRPNQVKRLQKQVVLRRAK